MSNHQNCFSPTLQVGTGRNQSGTGASFEQLVRLKERTRTARFGASFLPTEDQVAHDKSHVWIVSPATLAIDGTSKWKKHGALSGVEFDAGIFEHHLNFPYQDTLLDCKNWADGGAMDLRAISKPLPTALIDFTEVRSKIESVVEQINRQLIAASSLAIETTTPAHVEWIFSHPKTLFSWGQILFRPHTVEFLAVQAGSLSWKGCYLEKGGLPGEVQDALTARKGELIKKAVKSYSVVYPGNGTRKCDDFLQRLTETKISFRSFSGEW
jgi:hypothetical protein